MTIDLGAGLRRVKPDKQLAQLTPRPADQLTAASDVAASGRAVLVLDTNVYIRAAAGTLPDAIGDLLRRGLLFHCSVAMSELATGVANADPAHQNWPALRDHYRGLMESIPATRILSPAPQTWIDAGLIAGTLARTQNFQRHQRKECLNDALIFLTAASAGLPVLTTNRNEFDFIQQLAPQGRFLHF